MFDFLTDLIDGSAASYLVIAGVVALDSFFPLVPGETAMITGGVLAANGDLSWVVVVLAGWVGGMAGDQVTYWLGRGVGVRLRRRLFSGDKALHRLAWAEHQLEHRGGPIIVAGRFIPGGRTATMFSAGSLEMPWRRFTGFDAIAAAVWSAYALALGYVGGNAFRESLWKPLAVAFAIAAVVALGGEIWRRRSTGEDDEREVGERAEKLRSEQEGAA